jgi:hypothetical protein
MKLNKVLIIISIPFLVNLIIGCCDCIETMFFDYTNCSVSIENLDNSGREVIVSLSNQIPRKAFGLRINIERKEDVCGNDFQPLFISPAYAISCDYCPEKLYLPLDSIVSLDVITNDDFDSGHSANDNISEYFSVLMSTEFISINEFINRQHNELYDINNSDLQFDLMLMSPPDESSEYQFEVQIELSDGRVLTETSAIVELI